MATVTAFTAARSLEIEQSSVTTGLVDVNGDLILTTRGGTEINAGHVVGPAGTPMNTIEQTVKNLTGFTVNKGTAVYITGSTGDNVLIGKAQANAEATSSKTLGLVSDNILNDTLGDVTTEGEVTGLDTSMALTGDSVWLSPSVPGGLVYGAANKPTSPNHMVYIGVVLRAHAQNGSILVKVQNGYELDELHDVSISSPALRNFLVRNASNTGWTNRAIEANDLPNLQALNGTLDIASGGTDATTVKGALDNLGVNVLQTVFGEYSTAIENTTASWYNTGLSATITPRFSTSKILVITSQSLNKTGSNASTGVQSRLMRNGSQIRYFFSHLMSSSMGGVEMSTIANNIHLDSPGTTSAMTYSTQFANILDASMVRAQYNGYSSMLLMEIK